MRKLFLKILVLTMIGLTQTVFANWHFYPKDVNALHSAPADQRISYGNDPMQFGDLRLPSTPGPHPVAIVIHGGCWISKFADLQNTAALADSLRDLGVATWNINYRTADVPGGGWPGTFQDVASAADYITTIAKKFNLDLNRVISVGHSAGGHLALWLAARHQLPTTSPLYSANPQRLRGVLVLGGPADLKRFREHAKQICDGDVVGKLLGSNDVIEQRYLQASPINLLPLKTRQIILLGAEDNAIPMSMLDPYIKKARKKGDKVEVITIPYSAHHEYIVPNSMTWIEVRKAVEKLAY